MGSSDCGGKEKGPSGVPLVIPHFGPQPCTIYPPHAATMIVSHQLPLNKWVEIECSGGSLWSLTALSLSPVNLASRLCQVLATKAALLMSFKSPHVLQELLDRRNEDYCLSDSPGFK